MRETISASEGAKSMSRVRREGMESIRRRGSMSRVEDWASARVSPGTLISTRRRPESSFVHDQSRGTFGLMFRSGLEMADGKVFMIPRKPGRESEDFRVDLGSVEVVPLIPFISWMRGVLPVLKVDFSIPMSESEGDAGVVATLVKAAMVDAGR